MCAYWAGQLLMPAQTALDLRTQTKNVDFTQALSTKPNKSGATLPPACTLGETFFLTGAPAGQNLYGCTDANAWSGLGANQLPTNSLPGQILAWDGSSWQPKSGLGISLALSFVSIADGTCSELPAPLPFPWPTGSPVTLTMPAQYCDLNSGTCYAPVGLMPSVRVSAPGIATLRMCNFSGAAQSLPTANYGVVQYGSNATKVTLAFPPIPDGNCAALPVSVLGAMDASAIAVGLPSVLEQGLMVVAAPAGVGLVTITACNWSGATLTPAPASYQINVI